MKSKLVCFRLVSLLVSDIGRNPSYKNLAKFFRVLDPSMREKYVSVLCNIEMETYKYF